MAFDSVGGVILMLIAVPALLGLVYIAFDSGRAWYRRFWNYRTIAELNRAGTGVSYGR